MAKQPKINRERAARAESTLKAGGYWDHNEPCAAADMMCDLRHLCDKFGWDFDDLNRMGADNYACEIRPDDIEQDVRRLHARGDYPILPAGITPAERELIADAVSNSDMDGDTRIRLLDKLQN